MGSSDGGGGGGYMMSQVGPPMPGLPVAGSPEAKVDPYNYGKYQNFLPEPAAEGPNPMATGLRPEMFEYRGPNDKVGNAPAAGGGGGAGGGADTVAQIAQLRDELAKIKASSNQFGAAEERQSYNTSGGSIVLGA